MAAPTSARRRFHEARGQAASAAMLPSARIPAPQHSQAGRTPAHQEAGTPSADGKSSRPGTVRA